MNTVWIMVCDASRARLYEIRDDDPTWYPVAFYDHAEARAQSASLANDHLGQRAPQGRSVQHNAPAPSSSPQETEKGLFAHSLSTVLDTAMRSNRFDRWVLVAPPGFLGTLKQALTVGLRKRLHATVDKDLIRLDLRALSESLQDVVRVPVGERVVVHEIEKYSY